MLAIPNPRRLVAIASVLALPLAAACGDDSSDATPSDAAPADEETNEAGNDGTSEDARDTAEGILNDAMEDTASDAGATVVIDGVTYEFRSFPTDPENDIYTYCTNVAGSLQGGLLLVDEAGAPVEGGEITFLLLEPGGSFEATGDPAELMIEIPELDDRTGFVADEIDAPASGRSASGTFTASNHLGDTLSGTIDVSC